MKEFNKEYGNFITPILADQEWYNKNVIDKVRGTIQRMYEAGIDPTRSVQGRAAISQLINSIDVGSVNKLRSSAANAEEFLKARKQLEAQGLYNPLLAKYDGPDINTYSTLDRLDENGNVVSGSGVWDKMSPTRITDMATFGNPYFEGMKPNVRRESKNGIEYSVEKIDENDLRTIADAHFNELVSTPQGQLMYKYYTDLAGGNLAEARNMFNNAVVDGQRRSFAAFAACCMVGGAVLICTFLDALILQLIIICLTLRKLVVRFNGDFRRQAVIVRTIVSDVQSTITINEGQVAITVQTTRMSCTQRNQVTMIDIVDGGCGVTEHRSGVGIDRGRA